MKRTPLNRQKPLARQSPKARAGRAARDQCRAAVMGRAGGFCEVCPRIDPGAPIHYATEVHEIITRARGGSITDPDNCVATCRRGHGLIHDYPKKATKLGLLARGGP